MEHKVDERSTVSIYTADLERFSLQRFVLALVAAMVIALVANAVAPPAPAHAAEGGAGVTWAPGDIRWEIMPDGRCLTSQSGTVNAKSTEEAKAISDALRAIPTKTDFPADSGIQDVHANVGSVTNTTDFPIVMHAYLSGDKCQVSTEAAPASFDGATSVTTQQALFEAAGRGDLNAAQLAATPTWLKGAIAAVVGAAVYVGVSVMVTAGITATGVLVGATAVTIAAVTALSGCIGGAASTAVTLALASTDITWKSTLTNAAAGCVTGAAIGLLPIKVVGEAVGNSIRGALGGAPAAVIGEIAMESFRTHFSDAATSFAVSEAMNLAADAAIASA